MKPHSSKSARHTDFFIFIFLSRESDGFAVHRTNPDSLRSCPCFRVFCFNFASDFFNLLLVKFLSAEIIVEKHLIQQGSHGHGKSCKNIFYWIVLENSWKTCKKLKVVEKNLKLFKKFCQRTFFK